MDHHMAINLNVNVGYHPPLSGGPVEPAASVTPKLQSGTSNMVEASAVASSLTNLLELQSKSDEPPRNSEKVAILSKAIADGSYKVDSRRLADNILKHEKMLSALRRVD